MTFGKSNSARLLSCVLFALCAGLTACASSQPIQTSKADEPATMDHEAIHSDITFLCSPDRSSLILSSGPVDRSTEGYEQISVDLGSLITYEEEDSGRFVWRTGTKTTSLNCGELTVSIQGAFYNANPNGELGAADDYAVVTIYRSKALLVGPIALGSCSSGNPRYNTYAECPEKWATEVSVYPTPEGKHWIELQHSYDELIQLAL
jgi:hypothetical protein